MYRTIFRGIGVLIVAGMLTALALAIYSQLHSAPAPAHRSSRPTTQTEAIA